MFLFGFQVGGNVSSPVRFSALVLVDRTLLPDIFVNCENDALIDPLQLSDPTATKAYPSGLLCMAVETHCEAQTFPCQAYSPGWFF